MGNLAEQLYRAYCNAAGLVYGSDETPSFHNLPTDQREAWKAVAASAEATLVDNRLVLMSDGPLEETVKRAAVVIDVDGHVIKNRYGAVTKGDADGTTPIDDLVEKLIVDLHALERDGMHTNGHRLETLIGKTHAIALCVSDTRLRLRAIERKLRNA